MLRISSRGGIRRRADIRSGWTLRALSVKSPSKQYEGLEAPAFPTAANVMNWMMTLAQNIIFAGGYQDY